MHSAPLRKPAPRLQPAESMRGMAMSKQNLMRTFWGIWMPMFDAMHLGVQGTKAELVLCVFCVFSDCVWADSVCMLNVLVTSVFHVFSGGLATNSYCQDA